MLLLMLAVLLLAVLDLAVLMLAVWIVLVLVLAVWPLLAGAKRETRSKPHMQKTGLQLRIGQAPIMLNSSSSIAHNYLWSRKYFTRTRFTILNSTYFDTNQRN